MFRRLLSVTRVGPKLALSVLSSNAERRCAAIVTNNAAAFDRVPAWGERPPSACCLNSRSAWEPRYARRGDERRPPDIRAEAVAALVSLGYDGLAAGKAVAAVETAGSVETLITAALRKLAK